MRDWPRPGRAAASADGRRNWPTPSNGPWPSGSMRMGRRISPPSARPSASRGRRSIVCSRTSRPPESLVGDRSRAPECAMLGPAKPRRLDQPIAVSLEALVPADNFYRHLEAKLDLGFVRGWVEERYAARGRPSIDPVVFFKLQLVMFFEGIRSERKLIETASLNLTRRWNRGWGWHHARLLRPLQSTSISHLVSSVPRGSDCPMVEGIRSGSPSGHSPGHPPLIRYGHSREGDAIGCRPLPASTQGAAVGRSFRVRGGTRGGAQ